MMEEEWGTAAAGEAIDVGDYCRRIEHQLTRVNGGHLVRIVGPAFDLVRGWAADGIPLSVVFQAVALKAERHVAGASRYPLRIEHCDRDVRDIFDRWRRAIGLHGLATAAGAHGAVAPETAGEADGQETGDRRRPSLSRHLERAMDGLGRAAGRLESPEPLREAIARLLEDLAALREQARGARGPARQQIVDRLAPLDLALLEAARAAAPDDVRAALRREAEAELAPYRTRLDEPAWTRGVQVTADRLLREQYGLPFLNP
ncbi:MAG: hypothetical protein R2752_09450 [Vicinamibacterales bacterium]